MILIGSLLRDVQSELFPQHEKCHKCIITCRNECAHTGGVQGAQEAATRSRRMHVLVELIIALDLSL